MNNNTVISTEEMCVTILKQHIDEKDKEIAELKAMNDKLKGLLKEYIKSDYGCMVEQLRSISQDAPSFEWFLWNYCKEHGLEP